MKSKNKTIQKLLNIYKEIALLGKIDAILDWDLNVNLPEKASVDRADQSSYITEKIVEKWLDPEFKALLEKAKEENDLSETDKAIMRNLTHAGKFYFQVPKEIIVEQSKTTSKAFMAWAKAKKENKFSEFAPHLEKIVELAKIIAGHLGYEKNPYDALLDQYEQGLTAEDCEKIFAKLTPALSKIVQKKTKEKKPQTQYRNGTFTYEKAFQENIALFVLKKMGYDLKAGRMDVSSHPFTTTLGIGDVRITNRYKANDYWESLMVAMHEGGHALYDQGVKEEFANSPLDGGVSLGIHESQSRFWENQVGRSKAFAEWIAPIFQAYYPENLGEIDPENLYLEGSRVMPGCIRTDADEVTYNLHIALRFEIENALINNKLKVKDIPDVWRQKMKKYMGIVPQTDTEGCLQDVHWSYGSLGYFPTYTLGNLYSAQFVHTMQKELDFEETIKNGRFRELLSWQRDAIHQYGSLYWPKDLVKKITGEPLNPKYFIDYISQKYK